MDFVSQTAVETMNIHTKSSSYIFDTNAEMNCRLKCPRCLRKRKKELFRSKTLNPKNTCIHKPQIINQAPITGSINNLHTPSRCRTHSRCGTLTDHPLVLTSLTKDSPELLARSEVVLSHTRRRLPRIRSFIPTVRDSFDHFVHDILADFRR
jgi:hypothetical protein